VRKKLVAIVVVMVLLFGAFSAYRWDVLDKAGLALKEDNGLLAIEYLKPLASLGDTEAQSLLGDIYAYGWACVPKDADLASTWFRKCGACGGVALSGESDPAAPHQLIVAKSYLEGEGGVERDPLQAKKWLKRAVQGGSKQAERELAALCASSDAARLSGHQPVAPGGC